MKNLYAAHIKRLRNLTDIILDKKKLDGLVISSSFMNYYVFDDRSIPLKVNPHFAYWVPSGECLQFLCDRTKRKDSKAFILSSSGLLA